MVNFTNFVNFFKIWGINHFTTSHTHEQNKTVEYNISGATINPRKKIEFNSNSLNFFLININIVFLDRIIQSR